MKTRIQSCMEDSLSKTSVGNHGNGSRGNGSRGNGSRGVHVARAESGGAGILLCVIYLLSPSPKSHVLARQYITKLSVGLKERNRKWVKLEITICIHVTHFMKLLFGSRRTTIEESVSHPAVTVRSLVVQSN